MEKIFKPIKHSITLILLLLLLVPGNFGVQASAQEPPQPSTNPTKRPTYSEDGKTLIDQNDSEGKNSQTFYLGADKDGNTVENTPRDDSEGLNPLIYETVQKEADGVLKNVKQSKTNIIDSKRSVLNYEQLTQLGYVEGESCTTTSNSPIKNRRIGICQDGIYTISSRQTDTAGNKGEIISKEIERDTTSPFKPNLNIAKTGDIFGEFLKVGVSGEGESKLELRVLSPSIIDQRFEFFLDKNGNFSNNSLLNLVCGEIEYKIIANLVDRAGNSSDSVTKTIKTLECPRCSSTGSGLFYHPLAGNSSIVTSKVKLTSDYPIRKIPNYYYAPHAGLDFGVPVNTPIYASFDGKVKSVTHKYQTNQQDSNLGWGNVVILEHDVNGTKHQSIYAHLSSERVVRQGDTVSMGQLIGYSGNSGSSTGPHLHYQIEKEGASLDSYLAKDGTVRWNMRYPINPRNYLGKIDGNLTEEQSKRYCTDRGFGNGGIDNPWGEILDAKELGEFKLTITKDRKNNITKELQPSPIITFIDTITKTNKAIVYGIGMYKNSDIKIEIKEEVCKGLFGICIGSLGWEIETKENKTQKLQHSEIILTKENHSDNQNNRLGQLWNDINKGLYKYDSIDIGDNNNQINYGQKVCTTTKIFGKLEGGTDWYQDFDFWGAEARGECEGVDVPDCYTTATGYDRCKAGEYAREYGSSKRNSNYQDFSDFAQEGYGGNCTNFVSQVLHDGGGLPEINNNGGIYNSDWFYESEAYRAPTWAGTSEFYDHATYRASIGSRFEIVDSIDELEVGDVISLAYSSGAERFHTVVISDKTNDNIYLASNTSDYSREPWYPEDDDNGKEKQFSDVGFNLVFIKIK
jgi:hypothetical protein